MLESRSLWEFLAWFVMEEGLVVYARFCFVDCDVRKPGDGRGYLGSAYSNLVALDVRVVGESMGYLGWRDG